MFELQVWTEQVEGFEDVFRAADHYPVFCAVEVTHTVSRAESHAESHLESRLESHLASHSPRPSPPSREAKRARRSWPPAGPPAHHDEDERGTNCKC